MSDTWSFDNVFIYITILCGFIILVVAAIYIYTVLKPLVHLRSVRQIHATATATATATPTPTPPDLTIQTSIEMSDMLAISDLMCAICHDNMTGTDTISKLMPCKHSFHRHCVMQWFSAQYCAQNIYNCPACRSLAPRELINIKVQMLPGLQPHIRYQEVNDIVMPELSPRSADIVIPEQSQRAIASSSSLYGFDDSSSIS